MIIFMILQVLFVRIMINLQLTVIFQRLIWEIYLVIHDTGAHGFAMGYNYNGKLKSAEILLHEDGTFDMIRRAETPRDYFATFDCFPIYEKILEDEDRLYK